MSSETRVLHTTWRWRRAWGMGRVVAPVGGAAGGGTRPKALGGAIAQKRRCTVSRRDPTSPERRRRCHRRCTRPPLRTSRLRKHPTPEAMPAHSPGPAIQRRRRTAPLPTQRSYRGRCMWRHRRALPCAGPKPYPGTRHRTAPRQSFPPPQCTCACRQGTHWFQTERRRRWPHPGGRCGRDHCRSRSRCMRPAGSSHLGTGRKRGPCIPGYTRTWRPCRLGADGRCPAQCHCRASPKGPLGTALGQ